MSWKDEEIDNMYKESAENVSFEYKDEYWKEMEALLPKSRGRDFLWFFTAFLFVGIIGVTPFVTQSSNTDNKSIAQIDVESNHLQTSTEKQSTSEQKLDNTITSEEETQVVSAPNNSNPNNSKQKGLSSTDGSMNSSSKATKPTIKSKIDDALNDEPAKQNLLIVNDGNKTEATNDKKIDNEIGDLPIRDIDIRPLYLNIEALPPYEIETTSYIDFYAQLMGGVSQSLSIPSDAISNSYGLGFGAQVHKGQFQFTTGLNALISNHNDLQLNRTAKVYGFGSDVYNFNIDYKQIYSLELLLEAGYQFGRHQVNVGLRPSYAFSSKVRLNELNMDGNQSVVNSSETRDVYGYMDGINQLGLKPMIGYSFNLTPSIVLGANVGVQLMPSINQDFLSGSNRLYPIDGQVYFRKSFSIRR